MGRFWNTLMHSGMLGSDGLPIECEVFVLLEYICIKSSIVVLNMATLNILSFLAFLELDVFPCCQLDSRNKSSPIVAYWDYPTWLMILQDHLCPECSHMHHHLCQYSKVVLELHIDLGLVSLPQLLQH